MISENVRDQRSQADVVGKPLALIKFRTKFSRSDDDAPEHREIKSSYITNFASFWF
jgi:hypothetical protein